MTEIWCWINKNSGGVQAVGSVAAILIAVGVAWLSSWLAARGSANAQRMEEVRALETVASIVINAMNLIQIAKEQLCDQDGNSVEVYCQEFHDRAAFSNAGEALREIPVVDLPDFEVVKPILEMRDLILAADRRIAQICSDYHTGEGNWMEGIDQLRDLHRRANVYVSNVEDAVRRVRDGD